MKHAAPSPAGCPGPALWARQAKPGGMDGAAVVVAFFTGAGGLY